MGCLNSARRRLRILARLTGSERALLLQAAMLLPLAAVGRRLMSFRRLVDTTKRLIPLSAEFEQTSADVLTQAGRIAWLVQGASSHSFFFPNCLERSWVLWMLLRRRGINSRLLLGAHKPDGRFEAHAWVEFQGVVLNDAADVAQRYAVFPATAIRTGQETP